VVVIALGANDGSDPWRFAATINEVMARLHDVPRVFWVNMRQFRSWVPAANHEIAAATTRFPNLRLIDWDGRSTLDPFTVYSDGVHLPPYGRAVMAEVVAVALDTYIAERTAPLPPLPTTAPPVEVQSARSTPVALDDTAVSWMVMLAMGGVALLVLGAATVLRTPKLGRAVRWTLDE
jgi:hypothetical protein